MAKIIGIDLGTTNSCVAVMEGNEPVVIPNSRRTPHDPFGRGIHGRRRTEGGRSGQASGHHQPQAHDLLDQAFHGRDLRPGIARRSRARHLCRRQGRQQHARAWKSTDVSTRPQEISAIILQKMKKTAEDYLGTEVERSRHHGSGLLLRLAASGYEGGGRNRGPESTPHHQRADGRSTGLRLGQEAHKRHEDRRIRPGRRYVRYFDPRTGRRRFRSEVDQRRYPLGR